MTEKKTSNRTNKLKNFLVTGSVDDKKNNSDYNYDYNKEEWQEERDPPTEKQPEVDILIEEEVVIEDITIEAIPSSEPECRPEPSFEPAAVIDTSALEKEIAELKEVIAALTSELGKYTTTKEQLKEFSAVMNKRDAELANKKFISMLEQMSAMREDFFKLCKGMNAKLDRFSPKDVLSSFEAFSVDMENILVDCGVQIGPSKFEKLNTLNQRIVDVIPTDDESKNGMVAERVSDWYVYQGRVLQKEKVKIYRFSGETKTEGDVEK